MPGKNSLIHETFGVQTSTAPGGSGKMGGGEQGTGAPGKEPETVHVAAAQGISGASAPLPHLAAIQHAFGSHDVSGVQAHTDAAASAGSRAMGAEAYATGDHVAFDGTPSLHTAAHEAAHVVQQRAGVHLKGGIGEAGDSYERHADEVADRVVAGQSAQALLDQQYSSGSGPTGGGGLQHKEVQRKEVQRQVPPAPAGPSPGGSSPGGSGAPLDRLRAAVQAQNAADIRSTYGALQVADKVAVAHDPALLTQMVRLLDPSVALAILTELALPRPTLLQVAAGGKPGDATFLSEVRS